MVKANSFNDAQGMTSLGPPLAGRFAEGQTLTQSIRLSPGQCYTVLAASGDVQELELVLRAGADVVAQSRGTGERTAIGGAGGCLRVPAITTARDGAWSVRSVRGAGIVAGRAYAK
jgi:hypothetical protein